MDFTLTEEQSLLKSSVERLLAEKYSFEQRKKYMTLSAGWSNERWQDFVDLGLMALPFSEEDGGLGGGAIEMMIVMEAMGQALVLEPFFPTVVFGGGFLKNAGTQAQRQKYIPPLIKGELKLAFAGLERKGRDDLPYVATTATRKDKGWVISGDKHVVLHGDSADKIFVTARTSGDTRDEDGISLFLVDSDIKGVMRRSYTTQDGLRGADIRFDEAFVSDDALFAAEGKALPLVRKVVDEALAAMASEAVGGMAEMLKLTVEYLKIRKQFGVAISEFQILQHMSVDMFIAIEQARSMVYYATMMVDSPDEISRERGVHGAKAEIGRYGTLVAQNAVQLHGGVGMTMEYAIGHYFKRATVLDLTFGSSDYHLQNLAARGGLAADL